MAEGLAFTLGVTVATVAIVISFLTAWGILSGRMNL